MGFKDFMDKRVQKLNESRENTDEQEKKKEYTLNAINPFTSNKKEQEKERVKQLEKERIPYCPKCHSTSLQFVENRKGLGLGVGITRNVGVAVGSSKASKKGMMKCLNCGHTWKL